MARPLILILLFLAGFSFQNYGQHIQRRASIGIQPEQTDAGIQITKVFPGSTAAAIGLQEGDLLLEANGQTIEQRRDLLAIRDQLRAGDELRVTVSRDGKKKALKGKALAVPYETSAHSEVIYDEMPFKEGWLRLIINQPPGEGPHPTIFLVPGYTCASVDNFSAIHPYRKLVDSLSHLGYAIYRVEKPGVGDNVNTGDCFQLGFNNELAAYIAAYRQMEQYNFIDKNNIFILGHSMGGVYAPLIAKEFPAKGIIVYGTVHETWTEYLLRMVRFQNPYLGHDPIELDQDMHTLYQLIYEHYYQGKSSKELYKNPAYKKILDRDFAFDGEDQILFRHEDFWREINSHNLTEAWMEADAHVLSVFGEADLEALNSQSHEMIAELVNQAHPGYGTFHLLEGTDHAMIKVGSMEKGASLKGKPEYRAYLRDHFNYDLVTLIDEWIEGVKGSE